MQGNYEVSVYRIKLTKYGGVLFLIGLLSSIYVFINTPQLPGTELLCALPLTWAFCAFIFQDIIEYHRGGMGLKILYTISIARYLVLPIVTCYAGTFSYAHGKFDAWMYMYAIIIQCVELIVICITIKLNYNKEKRRFFKKNSLRNDYNTLSGGGMIVVSLAVALISIRGVNRMLNSMRFGIISEALDEESRYGYDIWLAQTMMAFFAIVVVDFFKKKNETSNSFFNSIIPAVVVAITCLIVFGNNRTMIIYYAFCGLLILTKAFPKQKKLFYYTVIPSCFVVLLSFSLLKQFHIDLTGKSNYVPKTIDVKSIQRDLTAYLCGTESIAKCLHLFEINGDKMSLFTIFADIVNKTSILGLPGLNSIVKLFSDVPTSYSLAMNLTEIVPVAGQTFFYGGYTFGFLLDLLSFYFIIWLLVKCDVRASLSKSTAKTYIFGWLAGIFGLCMCRSISVIYANCTYIPFYLSIAIMVNQKIKLRNNKSR